MGLSEQEYQQIRAGEPDGDHASTGALYAVLKSAQDGPEAEAAKQKEVIQAFHRHYSESLSVAAEQREARVHRFDEAGFGPDEPDQFAEFRSISGLDVEELYDAATLRPGSLGPEDAATLAAYKRWLYGAPLTEEDEPLNLASRALSETVAGLEDGLMATLEARRRDVLPAFLR